MIVNTFEGDDQIVLDLPAGINKVIYCGSGDDQVLDYGLGYLYALGEEGDDYLQASYEYTYDQYGASLYGGPGADLVFGSSGKDFLRGDEGDDRIWAGSGNDLVFGNDGNDELRGEAGDDTIKGGFGDDLLIGDHVVSGVELFNNEEQITWTEKKGTTSCMATMTIKSTHSLVATELTKCITASIEGFVSIRAEKTSSL